MKKTTLILLSVGCLLASSCLSSHFVLSDSDLTKAQSKYPGVTQGDLETGRKLYIANCSSCHNLHRPDEFKESHWLELVPEMGIKAKLSTDETKLIEEFLVTKAQD